MAILAEHIALLDLRNDSLTRVRKHVGDLLKLRCRVSMMEVKLLRIRIEAALLTALTELNAIDERAILCPATLRLLKIRQSHSCPARIRT